MALSAWVLPLRMARRDALRHRARSMLVLVMIALPVLGVTAADVAIHTADVSGTESLDRRIGASAALVVVQRGVSLVDQAPDPDKGISESPGGTTTMASSEDITQVLGPVRLVELRRGEAQVATDKGATSAEVTEVDLRDPVAEGLFDLTSGRLPTTADEVVINGTLADSGYAIGDPLVLTAHEGAAPGPTIVGIAESTTSRNYPLAAGPLGAFGVKTGSARDWLVDGGPVSWDAVRALNAIGATVTSRAVITDPPPASEIPDSIYQGGTNSAEVAVLVLIVVMALIEVVLLAGPAFAVGARRQQRSLALMAATGGSPRQSRRVVMAGAIVLGGTAEATGGILGIGVAWLVTPLLQARSDTWLGPFDIPWLHLMVIAGFGVLSALLAAVVPAHLASRQDVVAVLAGRRGDPSPSSRFPLLGLLLLGVGIAGSAYGARSQAGGALAIAASAVAAVLGMILLVPVVLAALAHACGRLPLVLRYAIRDAARHRTRTVPAVAAVAASVAGVVALGIGLSSDQDENRQTYEPSVAAGTAVVADTGHDVPWIALRGVVERELPRATITEQRGLTEGNSYTEVHGPDGQLLLDSWGTSLGSSVLVSEGSLPPGLIGIADDDVAPAERALRAGGIVAFVSPGVEVDGSVARVVRTTYDPQTGQNAHRRRVELPAYFARLTQPTAGPAAVLSPTAARQLGVTPTTVALVVRSDISRQQEDDVDQALAVASRSASMYVERGYQPDDAAVIAQLILVGLGGMLMLGGTLTATFLALSDARPDLATLSAVGASPRARRGVAAAYALVVGVIGSALGAVIGFIPGIAVTYPLTYQSPVGYGGGGGTGPFLDIPWLMIGGLVVALPLLTALLVGLIARSRLPLVARLD